MRVYGGAAKVLKLPLGFSYPLEVLPNYLKMREPQGKHKKLNGLVVGCLVLALD